MTVLLLISNPLPFPLKWVTFQLQAHYQWPEIRIAVKYFQFGIKNQTSDWGNELKMSNMLLRFPYLVVLPQSGSCDVSLYKLYIMVVKEAPTPASHYSRGCFCCVITWKMGVWGGQGGKQDRLPSAEFAPTLTWWEQKSFMQYVEPPVSCSAEHLGAEENFILHFRGLDFLTKLSKFLGKKESKKNPEFCLNDHFFSRRHY